MKTAIVWLDNSLHFTHWKSSEVAALPEITVRDWAAKSGVVINKRYPGDNEEGGIVTLDLGAPKLSQQELDVLPLAQWKQQREQFVYSLWAQSAIAAAEAANR